MLIKQISIFVQNKSGRLAEITSILGEKNINIHALSIADTTDFGILRLIVSNPEVAAVSLKESGLTVKTTDVIGISVDHTPGGLAKALKVLNENDVAIEYMYAFVGNTKQTAMVIIKVEDNEKAINALEQSGIKLLDENIIKEL